MRASKLALGALLGIAFVAAGPNPASAAGTGHDSAPQLAFNGLGEDGMLPLPDPAPVAAEPAPEMPSRYLVFFAFDSAVLNEDAVRVIDTAAENAAALDLPRVQVFGHADRSGSNRYNVALSQSRAEAVMQRLVAQGVPMDRIEVIAEGETYPLVPTPNGVRESQNRRAQIVFP